MSTTKGWQALFYTFRYSLKCLYKTSFNKSEVDFAEQFIKEWAQGMLDISETQVIVEGSPNVNGPHFLVANHKSQYDIPILLSVYPGKLIFLAKKELKSFPVFGTAIERLGFLFVDRRNSRKALKSMVEVGKEIIGGKRVLIFPEGTRSRGESMLPFKRGAFIISIKI